MKKRGFVILCSLLILFSGCGKKEAEKPPVERYIIPNSYLTFTGTNAEETVASCLDLGEKYFTDAKVVDDGVQIEMTPQQKDNFIKRNNDFIKKLAKKFKESNSMYRYVPDENYQKLAFYYDEKISTDLQIKTVFGIATGYALNYMLTHHTTDWEVAVTIYNCHTKKEVVSIKVPKETVSYGLEEWKKSYE